jgi:hypothetical protein
VSFEVCEFAVLADGTRLTFSVDRGFAVSGPILPTADDPLAGMSACDIERHARTTVMPDDVDSEDEHPYELIRDALLKEGVDAQAASLREIPYTVELGPLLRDLLSRRA